MTALDRAMLLASGLGIAWSAGALHWVAAGASRLRRRIGAGKRRTPIRTIRRSYRRIWWLYVRRYGEAPSGPAPWKTSRLPGIPLGFGIGRKR